MNETRINKIAGKMSARRMKADSSVDLINTLVGWGVILKQHFRSLDRDTNLASRLISVDFNQAQRELNHLEGSIESCIDDLKEMLGSLRSSSVELLKVAATGDCENKVEDASRIPKRFGREVAIAEKVAKRAVSHKSPTFSKP